MLAASVGMAVSQASVFCFVPCVSATLPRCGQHCSVRSFPEFSSLDAVLELCGVDGYVGRVQFWNNSGVTLAFKHEEHCRLGCSFPSFNP
jgi:hypothetical protein